jgi:lipopolysaccharide/colanic/teichoic acid biosynthesis glycosyltransferase
MICWSVAQDEVWSLLAARLGLLRVHVPMLRLIDWVFAVAGLVVGSPVLVAIYLAGSFDTGSPIFRQVRLGRYQKPFVLLPADPHGRRIVCDPARQILASYQA